jgi:aspartate kinase
MLELASVGAKVLQTRSVSLAMKEGVRVQVLSSFTGDDAPSADELPGTMIVSDEEMEQIVQEHDMERQLVTGIAHDKNEAKVILTRVPDKPGAVSHIFGPLADASINVDMIIQNVGRDLCRSSASTTSTPSSARRSRFPSAVRSRRSRPPAVRSSSRATRS